MKRGLLFGIVIVMVAQSGAAGQEPRPAAGDRRREHVQMMEGVLSRAVRSGAEQVSRHMQRGNPAVTLFTGQARARGFILDGYGVFFDVEVPTLIESVVWSMQTLERDLMTASAFEQLRRALSMLPEGPARLQAEQAFKQVQQFGPGPAPVPTLPSPSTIGPARGAVAAAGADPAPQQASPTAAAERAQTAEAQAALAAFNPQAAYTESVQRAIIDAMLDYSHPMDLGADEWLTVAARGSESEGPLRPDEIYDAVTIVIRVKGADLAAYAADRTRRDEIRSRVQVRVF